MATDRSYAVVFDKSSDLIMLYSNPRYDKSDDILTAMGYQAGDKSETNESSSKSGSPSGNSPSPKVSPTAGERENSDVRPK